MALADHESDLAAQNEQLRTRVDQLEHELATLRAQTVQTVASAQETLYWFERWGVDFNALFARPQVDQLRKVVRALREVFRTVIKVKRRILS